MTSLSLSSHPKGYSVSSQEAHTFIVHSPYAQRHFELSMPERNPFKSFAHFFIGVAEILPIIGAGVSIVERAAVAIFSSCPRASKDDSLHFTKRDIEILSKGEFGLRHVTGKEQLDKESAQGVGGGCSLNLSRQLLRNNEPYNRSRLVDLFANNPQQAVVAFEEGVDDFIEGCLCFDLQHSTGYINNTPADDYCKTVDSCRFMFLRYCRRGRYASDSEVRDYEKWGKGLGRFPKYDVPAKQIKALPLVTRDEYATKTEQQGIITRETFPTFQKRVIAKYRTLLIRIVRENEHTFFAKIPPQEHKKSS